MHGFGWLRRERFKLDRLEADRNVAGLIAALGSDVRGDAALALGRLGEPRAIPYLVEVVRDDPEPNVRMFAVHALGQLQAKEAEGVFVEALEVSRGNRAHESRRGSRVDPGSRSDPAASKGVGFGP